MPSSCLLFSLQSDIALTAGVRSFRGSSVTHLCVLIAVVCLSCVCLTAFHAQVNLNFPSNDSIAQQHTIRLVHGGERKEQPLQSPGGNSYPLIIRLETLTPQATADGKQLQQVCVVGHKSGAPLAAHALVNSTQCMVEVLMLED